MISTKILADSISPAGHRITTWELTYPRYIHSEIMTHRMLAKNAASSRAIPIAKMIDAVLTNPAHFEQYGDANKGMSAQTEMSEERKAQFLEDWLRTGQQCAHFANLWKDAAAKQMVNRALEPWMHMTIICTGTEWDNFFSLRAHKDAQPEFQVLAFRMLDRYLKAVPVKREYGEWHLPMVTDQERNENAVYACQQLSVARCARISYTTHDRIKQLEEDLALHNRLLESGHMSPFEHQAVAENKFMGREIGPVNPLYCGCFKGWKPYRKFLPNENRTNVDLHALLAAKPQWITLE
jgi:thymidylate synthase ThyX